MRFFHSLKKIFKSQHQQSEVINSKKKFKLVKIELGNDEMGQNGRKIESKMTKIEFDKNQIKIRPKIRTKSEQNQTKIRPKLDQNQTNIMSDQHLTKI